MRFFHSTTSTSAAIAAVLLTLLISGGCSDQETAEAAGEATPAILDLESFLTNINDPIEERYCKLTVKLAITPPEAVDEILEDALLLAQVRDRILTLTTAKTFLDFTDPMGKEKFREEIRTELSELLTKGQVKEVLFAEFVVQ